LGRRDEMLPDSFSRSNSGRYATVSSGLTTLPFYFAARGRLNDARGALEAIARDGFACVPRDSNFVANMLTLIEPVIKLWDRTYASALYEALVPYTGQVGIPGAPIAVTLPVDL